MSALFFNNRNIILDRAAALRLPAMYQWPEWAEEGGLIGYGPRILQLYRDTITGDLHRKNSERRKAPRSSVEQSTRFEFVLASRLLRMRSEWRPQRTRDSEQFRTLPLRQADPGEPGAAGGVKAARRLREKAMVDWHGRSRRARSRQSTSRASASCCLPRPILRLSTRSFAVSKRSVTSMARPLASSTATRREITRALRNSRMNWYAS